MAGPEILDLGGKRRPSRSERTAAVVAKSAEPVQLDVQGHDEEQPPPRPSRRVRITAGTAIGLEPA